MSFKLKEMFDKAPDAGAFAKVYSTRLFELLRNIDEGTVNAVVDLLDANRLRGGTLFIVANGGSAAVASHIVNDLGPNSLVAGQPPFRVLSLVDNVESLTAIANDAGFEHVFEYQLRSLLKPGDVVLALSVSGNSPNVVRAVEFARANGGKVIAWCGFDGGRLLPLADTAIHLPTTRDEYGPVEDVFGILGHIVATFLAMRLGRKLHH